jgi:hypothetical protein
MSAETEAVRFGCAAQPAEPACGHKTMFSRTGDSLFEADEVQAAVLEHYAECTRCHPPLGWFEGMARGVHEGTGSGLSRRPRTACSDRAREAALLASSALYLSV